MLNYFMNKKYSVLSLTTEPKGAGEIRRWKERTKINAAIEPVNGEKLLGSPVGNKTEISLILYTKDPIFGGERIVLPLQTKSEDCNINKIFEIRQVETYSMPLMKYYKGYLVKTNENK